MCFLLTEYEKTEEKAFLFIVTLQVKKKFLVLLHYGL